jgi:hypothetical protein
MSRLLRGRAERVRPRGPGSLVLRALACWVLCVFASPALAQSTDSITIEWTAPAYGDVSEYEVWVSINAADPVLYLQTPDLQAVISGPQFQRGDHLLFEITAVAGDGSRSPPSPLSDLIFFHSLPAPQRLIATDGDVDNPIALAWDGVEGADSYELFRSSQSGVPGVSIWQGPATFYSDFAELNVPFYYTVSAARGVQTGALSDSVMAIRRATPPSLDVSQTRLDFTAAVGQTTGSQSVVLSNPGDWELAYNTFNGATWLRVTPPGGEVDEQPVTVTFHYDLESLEPGIYPTPVRIHGDYDREDGTAPAYLPPVRIDVTVTIPNQPPVIESPLAVTLKEGEPPYTLSVRATDPDNADAVVIAVSDLPAFASFQNLGGGEGVITLAPGFDDAGTHTALVSASDTGTPQALVQEVLTITVEDVNRPPVVAPIPPTTAPVGETTTLLVSAWDPDLGDRLAITTTTLPAFASFVDLGNGTGEFTFVPGSADVGSYFVVLAIVDDGSAPEFVGTSFELTVSE